MPKLWTKTALADATGCDRGTIRKHCERLGLPDKFYFHDLFEYKLGDVDAGERLDLQTERAKLAHEQTRVARLQADEKERKLADVDELMGRINELHEGFSGLIKAADIPDDRKEDILGGIVDFWQEWGAQF